MVSFLMTVAMRREASPLGGISSAKRGAARDRTGDGGFAIHCLTAWLRRQYRPLRHACRCGPYVTETKSAVKLREDENNHIKSSDGKEGVR